MILAVYGTLRRGGPANGLLKGGTWLGQDKIPGDLYDFKAFPGLRPPVQNGTVVVDLYDVSEEIILKVNKYEGYYPDSPDQSLFVLKEVVTVEGCLPCMTYEYKFPGGNNLIPSGDYLCAQTTG